MNAVTPESANQRKSDMIANLTVEREGAITKVTFNRPSEGNGFTDDMAQAFVTALDGAASNSAVVLLRAAGADFCTGRARTPGAPPPAAEAYARRTEYDLIFDCYGAIRRSPIPVVAAVQGRAMGFGAAVAALCDVSFAGETARFSIPEMAHNIMPTMVMSALFDRINRNAILWMAYSTELIEAEDALKYGLISRVVPDDRLLGTAEDLCRLIASYPAPAVRGLKEFLRSAPSMHEQGAVDYARSLHAMVNTSSELKRKSPAA
jgi:enoyl-CoA hydratase/carnithine racemase